MRLTIVNPRAFILPLVFLCKLLIPSFANAQDKNSTVTGVVSNEQNEPIRGVTVIARNTKTNFSAGSNTDTAGVFTFNGLPAGGPYNFCA